MKSTNALTLTFAFMDPPFESERTVTFFRLLDTALDKGANIRVFAYEGAVAFFTKASWKFSSWQKL
jgi:tRNA 2-thiouridine synthesizing protein D